MYLGDIGGNDGPARPGIADVQLNQTRYHFGITGRRFFNRSFAAQASFIYGRISGTDNLTNNAERYSRNLSFRNDILELSIRGEYHFLKMQDLGRTFRYRLDFNAFVFAGAGVFYHSPKAQYNGEWVALQPLQTEGKKYSRIQPAIPIGLGFQFRLDKRHIIGWDFGLRWTFTDYLDDVSGYYVTTPHTDPTAAALADRSVELEGSNDPLFIGSDYYGAGSIANPDEPTPRGNPENDDVYMFTGFTYSYALKDKRRSFKKRKYHFAHRKVKRRRSRAKF